MLMPCEIVTKQFVPALRACIIKDLYNKHKLTQIQIAKKLNLTQASISKYLAEDYGKDIKELVNDKKIQEMAKTISVSIVNEGNKAKVAGEVCKSCEKFFGSEWDCKISGLAETLLHMIEKK